MTVVFSPQYQITHAIANALVRIEVAKERAKYLPVAPTILASLQETARLVTTHYSTMIEGNHLTPEQITQILKHQGHFPGREREKGEVQGYYAALHYVEKYAAQRKEISERSIQMLHALVMGNGRTRVKPSSYREGQNVIRNSHTGSIVYMPPEAKDVSKLMRAFVRWLGQTSDIPCPIVASLAHYQFATIHPYYDGNGRTARLLTTLVLHLRGYDVKGLYSLEEYYARSLQSYYDALRIGRSHNYYLGREKAQVTSWIEYFTEGMAISFEAMVAQMELAQKRGVSDRSALMKTLDPRQRKVLPLFERSNHITSKQIGALLSLQPRTQARLCQEWVEAGFLVVADASNRGRTYRLAKRYVSLLSR